MKARLAAGHWQVVTVTVAGLTQKFTDILTYRYVDPAYFNTDDTSQVREGRGGSIFCNFPGNAESFQKVHNLLFPLN